MARPELIYCGGQVFATAEEREQVSELVHLVLDSAFAERGGTTPGLVTLDVLSGGRSGARIFKASFKPQTGRRLSDPAMVVKIAPRNEGAREKANYDRFVQPLLPSDCRPDLLGFAAEGGHAALCYSFTGDGDGPETLTRRLSTGDLAALDHVLSTLFEQLRLCWYDVGHRVAETGLASYYLQRYFDDPAAAAAAEEKLIGYAARYFGAEKEDRGYRVGRTLFPSIHATLFARPEPRAFRSCLLHGDLNSDNILIDRERTFAQLIDFQRTGPGDIYQDLVSIEASIRINYPATETFARIWEIERSIALDDRQAHMLPYASAIAAVRDTARRFFGTGDFAFNYPFAVAAVGLRLMKALDLTDAAQARISASALWAVKTL